MCDRNTTVAQKWSSASHVYRAVGCTSQAPFADIATHPFGFQYGQYLAQNPAPDRSWIPAQDPRQRPIPISSPETCAQITRTWGNQREKLYMTTAAMSVLPRPVGRHTSVFCKRAVWIISSWYSRGGVPSGYIQCLALHLWYHKGRRN